jgi:RimJ/RimL family protein N-acetyltransferase
MTIEPVTLENDFVRLDPISEEHREPLRRAGDDPELWRYARANQDGRNYDSYFDHTLRVAASSENRPFAVFSKTRAAYVGGTRFHDIDRLHKHAAIGSTWYAKSEWSGPVNPSCKLLLMSHIFDTLEWIRAEFRVDARNARSRGAVLKLGATEEAIMRKHAALEDGFVRDTVFYSVIRPEWPRVRDGLEQRLATFRKASR